MKFFTVFSFLRVIFVLLDPEPDLTEINADPYGSGSGPTTLNISEQILIPISFWAASSADVQKVLRKIHKHLVDIEKVAKWEI
jgi:hypothetical protein